MTMMLSFDFPSQASLRDEPVLPGLRQQDNFITPEEERALIGGMDGSGLTLSIPAVDRQAADQKYRVEL